MVLQYKTDKCRHIVSEQTHEARLMTLSPPVSPKGRWQSRCPWRRVSLQTKAIMLILGAELAWCHPPPSFHSLLFLFSFCTLLPRDPAVFCCISTLISLSSVFLYCRTRQHFVLFHIWDSVLAIIWFNLSFYKAVFFFYLYFEGKKILLNPVSGWPQSKFLGIFQHMVLTTNSVGLHLVSAFICY